MNKAFTNFHNENQSTLAETRFLLTLLLILSAFSILLISITPPDHTYAQVSSPNISYNCNPRCWGTNYWPNTVNGAYSFLDWGSANFNYGNGFVQNTMWLLDETHPNSCKPLPSDLPGDCYIEAGIRAYAGYGGQNVVTLIWADVRPGYSYAFHTQGGPIDTNVTQAIDIQIFKAGTVSWALPWCPVAGSEWCVYLYSHPTGPVIEGISGAGHTNTMVVSGYREGMEIEGTSGAHADYADFIANQYQDKGNNSYNYQNNPGNYSKYFDNPPADSFWTTVPGPGQDGGDWTTCITGAGC
ncbi:MAG: hypothetical protein ACRDIV_20445 [Ktedonobacteraceae bacterium]